MITNVIYGIQESLAKEHQFSEASVRRFYFGRKTNAERIFWLLPLLAIVALAAFQTGLGLRDAATQTGTSCNHGRVSIHLTEVSFEQEVSQSDLPTLVEMWAPRSQPGIELKRIINQLADRG